MRRRILALVAAAATVTLAATGCSGDAGAGSASGEVTVTFWYGLGGQIGQNVMGLVNTFNEQHRGSIRVVATYQGNYDDTITKIKASMQSSDTPTLVQIYEIGTRVMYDSKLTVPMQQFVNHDNYPLADLQKPYVDYFSIDGALQAMPFNGSTPVLYYNKDAFAQAGISQPPSTLAELRADAEKLSVRSGGQTTRYGFGAALYGWFLEQFAATSGELYCDRNNGRSGLATQVNLDSPTIVDVVNQWAAMVKDGSAVNTGPATTDAENAFMAGRMAITLDSAGLLGSFTKAAKFQVGTGFFPSAGAGAASGPIIGGAALWMLKNHPTREQQAAWQFVKYLTSPQTQATFDSQTGYIPVNSKALTEPVYQQFLDKNPAFTTAVDQVKKTVVTEASRGCLVGAMPQVRQIATQGLQNAMQGTQSAQQAMTAAATAAKGRMQTYNQSVK